MFSAPESGSSAPGRYYVVLCSGQETHRAILYPGVQMSTGKFNAGENPAVD